MKWETPRELVSYLRASPSSDAGRAAADMIEAKEAEIARLREALQNLLNMVDEKHYTQGGTQLARSAAESARAALNQQEKV